MTEEDFRALLNDQVINYTAASVSEDGETGFVLVGRQWQVWDIFEDRRMFDSIPAEFVNPANVAAFYQWLSDRQEKAKDKAYKQGRRYGENAMRSAIRNIIGAAPLVDLEMD